MKKNFSLVIIFFILSCGSTKIQVGEESLEVSESETDAQGEIQGEDSEEAENTTAESENNNAGSGNNTGTSSNSSQKGTISILSSYNHKPDISEDPEHPWFSVISIGSVIGVLIRDEEEDAFSCEWKVNGELRQSDCNFFTINDMGTITISVIATDAKRLSETLEKSITVQ